MTALRTTMIALSLALLTATTTLAGGPPLITDDAGTVDVGKVEIELNGAYAHDKETASGVTTRSERHEAEMKVSTGLYKNLGISLAVPYTFSSQNNVNENVSTVEGFGDMALELKHSFAELWGTVFAVKPSVILPTGKYSAGLSDGRWQFGGALIATREFLDGAYALHANLGYENHTYRLAEQNDELRNHFWSGSIAGETQVMKGLTAVVDFGMATNPERRSNEPLVYALTGARYAIDDHLEINAGVKLGLTKPEDDLSILYGLILKF